MRNKKKILIGVTGNIGSGKSLVCEYFTQLGCDVYYADDIAKELYLTNKNLLAELKNKFSEEIFVNAELSLDRFRNFLIKSKKNQKLINNIVHPFAIKEILKKAAQSKTKLILIEAALIFESGFDKYLDYTIVISSSLKNRITRVRKRGKLSLEEIKKISAMQMPEKIKIKKADFVIINNSTKKKLNESVMFLYQTLVRLI